MTTTSPFPQIRVTAIASAMMMLLVMIAGTMDAGAQTGSDRSMQRHVVPGVITVVMKDGAAMQSGDGGRNWRRVDTGSADGIAQTLQRNLARRRLMALAAAGATVSPNPTNGTTTIDYETTRPGEVLLVVYDAHGVEVLRRSEGARQAGAHSLTFDATTLPEGVCLYRISIDDVSVACGRVVVAR